MCWYMKGIPNGDCSHHERVETCGKFYCHAPLRGGHSGLRAVERMRLHVDQLRRSCVANSIDNRRSMRPSILPMNHWTAQTAAGLLAMLISAAAAAQTGPQKL